MAQQQDLYQYIDYLENLLHVNKIPFLKLQYQLINDQKNINQLVNNNSQKKLQTNLSPQLSKKLIQRYSRQMLLPQIKYNGQLQIINSKIAIIGCGGIGCPLGIYLGTAGVGKIGLFDGDNIQITNMHRQIAHKNRNIGKSKSSSLKESILQLNPHLNIIQYPFLNTTNLSNLDDYDIVLDGSDNPKCRYLVNDYCMKNNKLLISGACIGWQAQITAYGSRNNNQTPCYRCLWGNDEISQGGCSTRGVLGMIPGIVAMIMAVQTIKLIITKNSDLFGNMIQYDGLRNIFKKLKLRKRKAQCIGCGTNKLQIGTYDYEKYNTPCLLPAPQVSTINWQKYLETHQKEKNIILDVRSEAMYNIVHLKNSINIPLDKLKFMTREQIISNYEKLQHVKINQQSPLYISCKRGNDSRRAVDYLTKIGFKNAVNIKGGIEQYGKGFDKQIPSI